MYEQRTPARASSLDAAQLQVVVLDPRSDSLGLRLEHVPTRCRPAARRADDRSEPHQLDLATAAGWAVLPADEVEL